MSVPNKPYWIILEYKDLAAGDLIKYQLLATTAEQAKNPIIKQGKILLSPITGLLVLEEYAQFDLDNLIKARNINRVEIIQEIDFDFLPPADGCSWYWKREVFKSWFHNPENRSIACLELYNMRFARKALKKNKSS